MALADDRLQCVTKLRGLVGRQLNNEPAAAFQRDAHHDATALLGHLERAIARPRLHRRHAASPSLAAHFKRTATVQTPPRRHRSSNNRVDPSPYYPVFGRRMVMISYARRLRKPQEPVKRSFRRPASGLGNARRPAVPVVFARLVCLNPPVVRGSGQGSPGVTGVDDAGRLDEQRAHLSVGARAVLDTAGNHEKLPGTELAVAVAQLDR
jgi:hypothetical protein